MSWSPPSKVGDTDPSIAVAKSKLRKFSYGKALDATGAYTTEFGAALRQPRDPARPRLGQPHPGRLSHTQQPQPEGQLA